MGNGIEFGVGYANFEKWNAVVERLEYSDIRTAIIKEYEKHGSFLRTAEVFDVNECTIRNKLKVFGYVKINHKGRPKGRVKYPKTKITKDLPITECRCPKCGTKHKMKLLWIGRGIPPKFCKDCKKISDSISDMYQEIFYDWRCG